MKTYKEILDDLMHWEFQDDYTIKVFRHKRTGTFYTLILKETDDNAEVIQEMKNFTGVMEAKDKAIEYINTLS